MAYDGTFGDLSSAGDAHLFDFNDDLTMDFFGSVDTAPATSGFTAVNGTTVSPKDLFNSGDSVPPSTSFTNLTTPGSGYLDTPDDDYQTSPLFQDGVAVENSTDRWFSLFPDASDAATPAPMARVSSTSSANQILVHPGGDSLQHKRVSSNTSPTFSPAVKHSTVAGVGARKRDKPLPPIVVDEADTTALKRARNTAAARKSRAKKMEERDEFLDKITVLEKEVAYWKQKALERSHD